MCRTDRVDAARRVLPTLMRQRVKWVGHGVAVTTEVSRPSLGRSYPKHRSRRHRGPRLLAALPWVHQGWLLPLTERPPLAQLRRMQAAESGQGADDRLETRSTTRVEAGTSQFRTPRGRNGSMTRATAMANRPSTSSPRAAQRRSRARRSPAPGLRNMIPGPGSSATA